jgi:hypothetical protein
MNIPWLPLVLVLLPAAVRTPARQAGELDSTAERAAHAQAGQRVLLVHYPTMDASMVLLAQGPEAGLEALESTVARTLFGLAPPEALDLPLAAEERARFVGDYYVGCMIYWIAEDGQHLVLVSTEGPRWRLWHQGAHASWRPRSPSSRSPSSSRTSGRWPSS